MGILKSLSQLLPWNQVDPRAEESRRAHEFAFQKDKLEFLIREQTYSKAQELLNDLREICLNEESDEDAEREYLSKIAEAERAGKKLFPKFDGPVEQLSSRLNQKNIKAVRHQIDQARAATERSLQSLKDLAQQIPSKGKQLRLAELENLQKRLNDSKNKKIREVVIPGIVEKADISPEDAATQRDSLVINTSDMQRIAEQTGQRLDQAKEEIESLEDQLLRENNSSKVDRIKRRIRELKRGLGRFEEAQQALASKKHEIYEEFMHYRHGIHEQQEAINDLADINGIPETELRSDFPTFYYLLTRHRKHIEISYDTLNRVASEREEEVRRELEESRQEAERLKQRVGAQQKEIIENDTELNRRKAETESLLERLAKLEQDKERIRAEANKVIRRNSREAHERIASLEHQNSNMQKEIRKLESNNSRLADEQRTLLDEKGNRIRKDVIRIQKEQEGNVRKGGTPLQHYYYGFFILEAWRRILASCNREVTAKRFEEEATQMLGEENYLALYFDEAGRESVARYNFYREGKISYSDAKSAARFRTEWLKPFQAAMLRLYREERHPCQGLIAALFGAHDVCINCSDLDEVTWIDFWGKHAGLLEGSIDGNSFRGHLEVVRAQYNQEAHPNQEQIRLVAAQMGIGPGSIGADDWVRIWATHADLIIGRIDKLGNSAVK